MHVNLDIQFATSPISKNDHLLASQASRTPYVRPCSSVNHYDISHVIRETSEACLALGRDPRVVIDMWHFFMDHIWISIPPFLSHLLAQLYTMLLHSFRLLLVLSTAVRQVLTVPAPVNAEAYTSNAEAAFTTLQKWYNNSTGIYDTTGWWNSANCLTVIGDLAAVDPTVTPQVTAVLAISLVAAQDYNLQTTKIIQQDFMIKSFYDSSVPDGVHANAPADPKGFLNGYYDDEGWWALAWIKAYDITQNQDYLQTAMDIFADMQMGETTPCGGIWWDKAHTYVNAIANELYLSVAAHLANRVTNKGGYLTIAQQQLSWFQNSSMINSMSLINDGLTSACVSNGGTVWSYNQGVILGGLVELDKASPGQTYLDLAQSIATAAIQALGLNGVLHDPCEPNCGGDGSQFKGIFMRNLQQLQTAAPNPMFLNFIASNAKSIWASDRNTGNELGIDWGGPFINPVNAATQSSALDALVAAAAFEGNGISS